MGNSSLVNVTVKSPNHSGARTHSIDRITPHCVVGQLTASSIGGCFTSSDRQASCNYGIGSDGLICLVVDESNRSWCSSNKANDQRAVTIECASDKEDPYAFTDTVYNKLIELCVDVCKRNGKSKLLWFGDKDKTLNYEPASDEMVLTVHRWFANKSCPGDWMYARMGDLANRVTTQLGSSSDTVVSTDDGAMTDEEMYAYFKTQGLNDYGVSGLMGNLYAESGLSANNLQNTGNSKLGMTDAEYTSAVDNGSYDNFVKDGYGFGLAQWTYYSRKQALLDFMKSAGVSVGHKKKQCEFLIKELAGYTSVLNVLKNATSVLEASNAVLTGFEKPADQSASVQTKRAGYGQTYYDKYSNADTISSSTITAVNLPAVPFIVKVIIDDLNYRSEGSMNGSVLGQTGKGTFTIVEVNSDGWGKLKSGAGWIYLMNESYCTVDSTVAANANSNNSSDSFSAYTVKVTTALNIRKGPGTNYETNGVIRDNGVYTIVAESDGVGASKWGKLKSGVGWISLDFCTKL